MRTSALLCLPVHHPSACKPAPMLSVRKRTGRPSSGSACQGHNRHPADSALRSRYGARFARVKLGLEHVSLDGLRDAYAPGRPIVVVAKHLCGAASDFALRAVIAACAGPHPPVAVVLGTSTDTGDGDDNECGSVKVHINSTGFTFRLHIHTCLQMQT